MAKLEEMDGIWADGRWEPKQDRSKKPVQFLQMRVDFIRKWGNGNSQIWQELDALLREYLKMMAT